MSLECSRTRAIGWPDPGSARPGPAWPGLASVRPGGGPAWPVCGLTGHGLCGPAQPGPARLVARLLAWTTT